MVVALAANTTLQDLQELQRRKGGGGHGDGHGDGSSGDGKSGSGEKSSSGEKGSSEKQSTIGEKNSSAKQGSAKQSSSGKSDGISSFSGSKSDRSSSSDGSERPVPISGSTAGRTTALAYGPGGGRSVVIPFGSIFAGRTSGGGTRYEIYGSGYYGSGYADYTGRGVAGRGFPFVFWPVVWGGYHGYGAPYLYDPEYGSTSNTSRPGGPLAQANFTSLNGNNTFYIISDNSTVASLITSVRDNCTVGPFSSTVPIPFNGTLPDPLPEQAIQYYRASSVALTLAGYNDTAALSNNPNATPVALPNWINHTLLDCLNGTIAEAVPLINAADARWEMSTFNLLALLWVCWYLLFHR